ncbi:hypothetical protein [Piscirickettsia litoralis]|uniref:Peptidase C58 YopT-type domain-containing protein n=1 Tax=Piscirickettsia litoralis TaxID=1891921 RepID=A0ABX3A2Y8_9GAMM|nr:hypothetical protein [Piscirickettsia litoralis]ODN43241.1 hypothetical protein BGC07_10325 [Piscirickettsia litoralis]
MCTLGGGYHRCAIWCQDNKFYFYDPNFQQGEKVFESLNDLIPTLRRSLSCSFSINLISLKRENLAALRIFNKFELELKHLEGLGFHALARYPNLLGQALEVLSHTLENAATEQQKIQPFLTICQADRKGQTGLHRLVLCSRPDLVEKFFALATTDQQKSRLLLSLYQRDDKNCTWFHKLMYHTPQSAKNSFRTSNY